MFAIGRCNYRTSGLLLAALCRRSFTNIRTRFDLARPENVFPNGATIRAINRHPVSRITVMRGWLRFRRRSSSSYPFSCVPSEPSKNENAYYFEGVNAPPIDKTSRMITFARDLIGTFVTECGDGVAKMFSSFKRSTNERLSFLFEHRRIFTRSA